MFDPQQELQRIINKVKCVGGNETAMQAFHEVLYRLGMNPNQLTKYYHDYTPGEELLTFTTTPDVTMTIFVKTPHKDKPGSYNKEHLHKLFTTVESTYMLRILGLLSAMVVECGDYTKEQRIWMMEALYKSIVYDSRFARPAYETYFTMSPIDPEYLRGDVVIHHATDHPTRRLYIGRVHKL